MEFIGPNVGQAYDQFGIPGAIGAFGSNVYEGMKTPARALAGTAESISEALARVQAGATGELPEGYEVVPNKPGRPRASMGEELFIYNPGYQQLRKRPAKGAKEENPPPLDSDADSGRMILAGIGGGESFSVPRQEYDGEMELPNQEELLKQMEENRPEMEGMTEDQKRDYVWQAMARAYNPNMDLKRNLLAVGLAGMGAQGQFTEDKRTEANQMTEAQRLHQLEIQRARIASQQQGFDNQARAKEMENAAKAKEAAQMRPIAAGGGTFLAPQVEGDQINYNPVPVTPQAQILAGLAKGGAQGQAGIVAPTTDDITSVIVNDADLLDSERGQVLKEALVMGAGKAGPLSVTLGNKQTSTAALNLALKQIQTTDPDLFSAIMAEAKNKAAERMLSK